jgi:hypothetical protein
MGACGGAVAVDCGGGERGVGAVLAAALARGGLLGAREAAAWVRLACAGADEWGDVVLGADSDADGAPYGGI